MNYSFDGKFEGNISVVGRTGCGKTTFVQNFRKMFGEIKELTWLSKIPLSRERENNIRSCLIDEQIDFKYPNNIEDFQELLEFFQRKKAPSNVNDLGENIKLDRLIVMDEVSGLADKSEEFANFLTVSRKFGLICVYIFRTIYSTRQNWQMILSQAKIFNIFPGSVQVSCIAKKLSSFCSRYKYNYIPIRDLWINRLSFDISNSNKKQCLTIDTRDVKDLGPAKFRTQANNNRKQICYYNRNKRDKSFNSFLGVRKQTSKTSEIIFSIVNIIDKANRKNDIYFQINDELSDFNNDNIQSKRPIQQLSESNISRTTDTDINRQHTTKRHGRVRKKPRFLSE